MHTDIHSPQDQLDYGTTYPPPPPPPDLINCPALEAFRAGIDQ